MTSLIVDASVAARWFVPALAWPRATALLESSPALFAPELILAETANAFWKCSKAGFMTQEEMRSALRQLPSFFAQLSTIHELLGEAADIAGATNHPVYDCFYVALAQREGLPLVTADKRLALAAKGLPDVEIILLSDR
jgi:predicted nucleic acid-binding protein